MIGDVGLQPIPQFSRGELAGAKFETAGDDLPQLLSETMPATPDELARCLDGRTMGNDG